jgi:hypothetical protein
MTAKCRTLRLFWGFEVRSASIFRVNKFFSRGCFRNWEEEVCRLYATISRIVAFKNYGKRRWFRYVVLNAQITPRFTTWSTDFFPLITSEFTWNKSLITTIKTGWFYETSKQTYYITLHFAVAQKQQLPWETFRRIQAYAIASVSGL